MFVVESPLSCNRNDILDFLGKNVEIDGVEYEVLGVETLSLATPLHIGENVGVLVSLFNYHVSSDEYKKLIKADPVKDTWEKHANKPPS